MLNRSVMVAVCLLFANSVWAQTILNRTNEVGVGFADHTLTMNRGDARLNITVLETPTNALNMSDITTFRATVKDLTDGRIMQTSTQDTTGENTDASVGQVRFLFSSLLDRGVDPDYEIWADAVASDTNQNYRIHWGYISVTSAPSASSTILVSNYIPITVTANVAGVSVVTTVLVDNVYSPSNSYYVTINQTNLTIVNITNQLDNITETITYNYSAGVHSVNSATGVVVIYDGFGNAMTNNGNNVYMVNDGTPTWLTFAPTVTVPVLDGKAYAFSATDAVVLAWSGVSTGYAGISKLDLYTVSNSFVSIASSNAPDGGDMTFTNDSWHSIIYYSQTGTDTVRFIQK